MKIAIISAFRNSASYIPRYCQQMAALQKLLLESGHSLHLVLGYGDSRDGTSELLYEECSHNLHSILFDVSHGGRDYGSVVDSKRFKNLAYVGNRLWSVLPSDADVVGLVESDLIWEASVVMELLNIMEDRHMVAPMIYQANGLFYDTWAYRMNGVNFSNHRPHHPEFKASKRFYNMDSVGSFFLLDGELAPKVYWPEEDVTVGLSRMVRDNNGVITLDSHLKVYHP